MKDIEIWGLYLPVLATSVIKGDYFYDNAKFKSLLSGE